MNSILVGHVDVVTSSHGGHTPEFFAEMIVARLIHVGDNLPEPIRAQALAYREAMQAIVLEGIRAALVSDRAYR
jgi:Ca2+/H+ antiporter